MHNRRDFVKKTTFAAAGLPLVARAIPPIHSTSRITAEMSYGHRPRPSQRTFQSDVIEEITEKTADRCLRKPLAKLFRNCFPNTLDTTVSSTQNADTGELDTFIITGDIPAMWLRDSTAQVWPYLPFVNRDPKLQDMFRGLINRQTKCINIDPYANAFKKNSHDKGWDSDHTDMREELHERKWEIDSLCYTVRLGYHYWKKTGDKGVFDDSWRRAAKRIRQVFIEQQRWQNQGPYKFTRTTDRATDTLAGGGYGRPANPCGLICSMFRPSDDACIFPYLIPSNLFAVVSLRQLSELHREVFADHSEAEQCVRLAREVEQAVDQHAVCETADGKILAYEADGYINKVMMDDANIPNLLSLPYLGAISLESFLYQNTRQFIISAKNPYWVTGKHAVGLGGAHTAKGTIWPLGLIMQALTSTNDNEVSKCLDYLATTHANTWFMHEGFNANNPRNYSRSWFAWANSLFGELILKLAAERPHLI